MLKSFVAFGLVAVVVLGTKSASAELIVGFDNVIGGNLGGQSQMQGRTVVRGDVTGGFAQIGTGLTPPANYSAVDSLVVGGGLQSAGLTMQAGDLRLGGTTNGVTVNLNGPGSQIFQNDASALSTANSAVDQLGLASDFYSNLTANSTTTVIGQSITFNPMPGPDGLAVFNLSAASLQNAQLISIVLAGVPSSTTFLVNVVGNLLPTAIQANFGPNFSDPIVSSHLLWNFQDQTSLLNLDREWRGSILLPDASLVTTGAINGSVLVGGNFTTSSDVRLPGFAGAGPEAVPEPSSFVLMSLAGVGVYIRRRVRNRGQGQQAL